MAVTAISAPSESHVVVGNAVVDDFKFFRLYPLRV